MKTSLSCSLLFLLSLAPAIAQTPSPAPVPPVPQPVSTSGSTTAPAPATTLPTTAPAPATTAPGTTSAETRTANSSDYRLANGDKLRIEVYREPQLSHSLQIRPDGKISLPLAGDLVATGQTPASLRDAITSALREYVNNPVVTVMVVETQLPTISVMGEVNKPGSVQLQGRMTVIEALAAAGGFKDFANTKKITIRRPTATGVQRIKFNYKEAVNAESEPVYVQAGDVIIVP